ncbi:MAG: D-alanyl-D-alanine carboxypeptidase/D-alanyl-D-alanine-endopeptidase [Thermodesulfobacteriota bacterium]
MARFVVLFLLLVILIPTHFAQSANEKYAASVAPLLNENPSKNGKLGVIVKSLNSGETIFEHNPEKMYIPASNEKIITSVAGLSLLGTNYKFKTEFFSGGGISDGVLHGGLYIKGYGDPTLSQGHLGYIVFQLKQRGVKEIRGKVVVDDSYFGTNRYAKGWKEEWRDDFYSPAISALSFNYNIIELKVYASKTGAKPAVKIEPEGSNITIINQAVTSGKKGALKTSWQNEQTIVLSGRIRPKATITLKIPVLNPTVFTGNVIKSAIEEAGIKVPGPVVMDKVPRWANLIYTHYSDPLSSVIVEYNKNSVNIIGENLMKTLGAQYRGVPGTWDKGSSVISEFLNELGIKNGYKVVDGSGLSLLNRVTPETLTDILSYAYEDNLISTDFLDSLPVAGVDGTLKKRFKNSQVQGRVRAKTGYLKNVRALSGYIFTKKGDVLVFSILSNGFGWKTKEFQNDLLGQLVECCANSSSGY